MNQSLYKIDESYNNVLAEALQIAEENNGVVPDDLAAKLDALEMARDIKIENCVKFYKNETALAAMIEQELDALERRIKSHKSKSEWMKNYLSKSITPGQKFEYSCGKISWRESTATEIINESLLPEKCFKVEKKAILGEVKKCIEEKTIDESIAKIVKRNNIQIK